MILPVLLTMTLVLPQVRVTVEQLQHDPTAYAGRTVTVEGELVGDYGFRTEAVWVQLNDDPYVDRPLAETGGLAGSNQGIGVRIPRSLFSDAWGAPGGYGIRGPVLLVTGPFRYNDPAEGGETFIDAVEVRLLEPSRPMRLPPVSPWPTVAGILLTLAGAGTFGWARWRRRPPVTS